MKSEVEQLMVAKVTPDRNHDRTSKSRHSFLDIKTTRMPSRSSEQYSPRYLGSSLCCGPGPLTCWSHRDDVVVSSQQQQKPIHNSITVFLESLLGPEKWCGSWQGWNHFDMEKNHDQSRVRNENVKHGLRNRAFDVHAKTKRIQKLKEDLCPFDITPEKRDHRYLDSSKTRSFCVSGNPSRQGKLSAIALLTVREEPSSVHSVANFWQSVQTCTERPEGSPYIMNSRGFQDDEICYDSDPEEPTRRRPRLDSVRRRTSTFLKQGMLDQRAPAKSEPGIVKTLATLQEEDVVTLLIQVIFLINL